MMIDKICIGAIMGGHGVHGAVKIKTFCEEPLNIAAYGPLTSEDGRQFILKGTKLSKSPIVIAKLDDVKNREQADALKGTKLYVCRTVLPPTQEDEFYHTDLIGMSVKDNTGTIIGKVSAVFDHGAGAIIEITDKSDKTDLVQFTKEFVPTINLEEKYLVINT